ncbi:alpha/beta hydrolase family esterase [uncultured Sphingomonas sp.]|uniref:alpha/beta hydrolase family esterase n=1 Tax=uncultured Sphingomonas sp. TaxID=158754 RepID=UPI0035C97086
MILTEPPRAAQDAADMTVPARRQTLLFRPASGPVSALAVELHGSGLDPERHHRMTGLAELLVPHGIAVLIPQAGTPFRLMPASTQGFAWTVPGAPLPDATGAGGATDGGDAQADDDVDDIAYLAALVAQTQRMLGLCGAPLFLSGYSGGARLASHLLTSGPLAWTAAALVAGLRFVEGHRRPPMTIVFHGIADAINPLGGGAGPRWDMSVAEAASRYARAQGCVSPPRRGDVPGADVQVHRTPDGEGALSLYVEAGAGHAWPGTRDAEHVALFGPPGGHLDASRLIADFFLARIEVRHPPDIGRRRPGQD